MTLFHSTFRRALSSEACRGRCGSAELTLFRPASDSRSPAPVGESFTHSERARTEGAVWHLIMPLAPAGWLASLRKTTVTSAKRRIPHNHLAAVHAVTWAPVISPKSAPAVRCVNSTISPPPPTLDGGRVCRLNSLLRCIHTCHQWMFLLDARKLIKEP